MRRLLYMLLTMLLASYADAQTFSHFGARAMGMGGAYVAVADDATSVYWNPAGLAVASPREVAVVFEVEGADEHETIDKVDALIDMNLAAHGRIITPEDIAKALDLLEALAEKGSGVSGDTSLDFIVAAKGLAFSVLNLGNASAVPVIDLDILDFDPNSGEPLPTDLPTLDFTGVVTNQFVATYALPLLGELLRGGVNVKYIRASSYYSTRLIVDPSNKSLKLRDILDEATHENKRTSSSWGFDVGLLSNLTPEFRIGVVGRDLNEPEFDNVGPWKARLNPQYRMGVAYQVTPALIVAADYDLSKNDEGLPGVAEREFSIGGEGLMANRHLALRLGTNKNVDIEGSRWEFAAGVGYASRRLVIDFGARSDSKFNQAAIAISSRIRF
ncbi:MAG: conjugal transfer protein TraF [Acidobacteriota bacterium]